MLYGRQDGLTFTPNCRSSTCRRRAVYVACSSARFLHKLASSAVHHGGMGTARRLCVLVKYSWAYVAFLDCPGRFTRNMALRYPEIAENDSCCVVAGAVLSAHRGGTGWAFIGHYAVAGRRSWNLFYDGDLPDGASAIVVTQKHIPYTLPAVLQHYKTSTNRSVILSTSLVAFSGIVSAHTCICTAGVCSACVVLVISGFWCNIEGI